ncbi:hypothetical protein [Corallococcus macrosporus]|uniref:Lipoprotein n=1 Tax=Corallococcus macrosporus DSM 14697 TaxID=1189310 RepID=A0A250K4Z5_9BACT|nr:hypothetical protein [Corallococcus macrosporus]ATB51144.1 hypothetical protein MYMAC_006802 [Corallococcus macrosporus DSM 14697]
MRTKLWWAVVLVACACGGAVKTGDDVPLKQEGLSLAASPRGSRGSFAHQGEQVTFSSRQVEPGVFRVEVRLRGLTLTGLMEPASGVSTLDGFAEANGADAQMGAADRALLTALYRELNAALPAGDAAAPEAMYLRRAVSVWSQYPDTVALRRAVMGEKGRGYTMLCSYARCNGRDTGSCGGVYNWYAHAAHDCDRGGFDWPGNQQLAQLGDHYSCNGDEFFLAGGTWLCGSPDHWHRPKVVGNCFGRCGSDCGGDTQYTVDATNHDSCVRNGHILVSGWCNDQFVAAVDDELFAPNCY